MEEDPIKIHERKKFYSKNNFIMHEKKHYFCHVQVRTFCNTILTAWSTDARKPNQCSPIITKMALGNGQLGSLGIGASGKAMQRGGAERAKNTIFCIVQDGDTSSLVQAWRGVRLPRSILSKHTMEHTDGGGAAIPHENSSQGEDGAYSHPGDEQGDGDGGRLLAHRRAEVQVGVPAGDVHPAVLGGHEPRGEGAVHGARVGHARRLPREEEVVHWNPQLLVDVVGLADAVVGVGAEGILVGAPAGDQVLDLPPHTKPS